MKIAIIGYGKEGRSSADYFAKNGHEVIVCDKNPQLDTSPYSNQLGDMYLNNLNDMDLIVRSPGIHPSLIAAELSDNNLYKVTSNSNEFFKLCPTRNVIGVTGTKGKGTTSSLIFNILKSMGKRVYLGGNIGLAPLELLKENLEVNDWVVLELSNFQLIDLKTSPHIAVCLLMEPEHQDWHRSLDEYIAAKQQLFKWQKPDDIAIFYGLNELSARVASVSHASKNIPFFKSPGAIIESDQVIIDRQAICPVDSIQLIGKHNWQNVCAAVTATWQISQDAKAIAQAIALFKGLPYRLELRCNKGGVAFYNDSFSSQPEATIAAIEALAQMKVIIIGGHDRQLDLSKLSAIIEANKGSIRKIILIGESKQRMADNLQQLNYRDYSINTSLTMSEIINEARYYAQKGDAIVLSPGFPSFDMFANFEDRGQQFNQIVERL